MNSGGSCAPCVRWPNESSAEVSAWAIWNV